MICGNTIKAEGRVIVRQKCEVAKTHEKQCEIVETNKTTCIYWSARRVIWLYLICWPFSQRNNYNVYVKESGEIFVTWRLLFKYPKVRLLGRHLWCFKKLIFLLVKYLLCFPCSLICKIKIGANMIMHVCSSLRISGGAPSFLQLCVQQATFLKKKHKYSLKCTLN